MTTSKKSVTITTINLESESKEIEGVTIVKERSTIEQKADRKVVNVGKDLIASGATASDIFNNIPTVSIDPQTKELSLRGNSNVRVFVDGKPTNIDAPLVVIIFVMSFIPPDPAMSSVFNQLLNRSLWYVFIANPS